MPEHGPPFLSLQAEIYLRGLAGELPTVPISLAELAREAQRCAEPTAAAYVFGCGRHRGHDACQPGCVSPVADRAADAP